MNETEIDWLVIDPDTLDSLPLCNVCDPLQPTAAYKQYNMVMTGILLPLIGLLGLIGNSISAIMFTRASMRNSVNTYLCALAVSDICVITTAFFLFFMEGMRRHDAGIAYLFGSGAPYFFPAGVAAQTCSVYFTVAAAIDCFLTVVLPRRLSLRWCTVRRALAMIAVIVVLSLLYNVTHCFEVAVVDCWDANFNTSSLQVCPTEFRMNDLYLTVYYVYMYTIVMAAGPLVVLIILNAGIIGVLLCKKRTQARRRRSQSDLDGAGKHCEQCPCYAAHAQNAPTASENPKKNVKCVTNPFKISPYSPYASVP